MEKYLSLLSQTRLFKGISGSEIASMFVCLNATKRRFTRGDYIFRIGQNVSSVALLLEGRVHILRDDYWGNRSILSEVCIGEIFGEAYAVSNSNITSNCPFVNDAVAVEDCVVLFIELKNALSMCQCSCHFHATMIQNLFLLLAEKNRFLTQKLGHMSKRTTREKLLSYLSEQQARAGTPAFEIPFNRQQLADFLSVDRSAMSNELCKMRDEGLLVFERSKFELKLNGN